MKFSILVSNKTESVTKLSEEAYFLIELSADIKSSQVSFLDDASKEAEEIFDSLTDKLLKIGLSPEEVSMLVG